MNGLTLSFWTILEKTNELRKPIIRRLTKLGTPVFNDLGSNPEWIERTMRKLRVLPSPSSLCQERHEGSPINLTNKHFSGELDDLDLQKHSLRRTTVNYIRQTFLFKITYLSRGCKNSLWLAS